MDNQNKKTMPLSGLRMFISGLLIFFGALFYIPSAGIIRTLPIIAVLSGVADIVYKNIWYTAGCSFLFSFCLLCVDGKSVVYSLIFSLLAALFSMSSVYGVRLLRAASKTKDASLKKRCTVRSICVLALCFFVYMLVCGNIIGAVFSRINNHKYVEKSYGEGVTILHTSFDAIDREYKTYVSFTHEGTVIGDRGDCFVSESEDNIRDYYEQLLLTQGKKELKNILGKAVDMFEITSCGIHLEDGEIITPDDSFDAYRSKAWYVVSLYHMVEDKEVFGRLYDDCKKVLCDAEFEKVILCGGNAKEVLYTAEFTKDGTSLAAGEIRDFDEEMLKEYGVTEKTVLDYWYNR